MGIRLAVERDSINAECSSVLASERYTVQVSRHIGMAKPGCMYDNCRSDPCVIAACQTPPASPRGRLSFTRGVLRLRTHRSLSFDTMELLCASRLGVISPGEPHHTRWQWRINVRIHVLAEGRQRPSLRYESRGPPAINPSCISSACA